MKDLLKADPNDFHCGLMITNQKREIIYANQYWETDLHWSLELLIGKSINDLFTRSSLLFFESYLLPILNVDKQCCELQLAIFDGNGERVPITINARLDKNGYTHWSFFTAVARNELYDKLAEAKKAIEQQASELENLSSKDELTGLLNRRAFNASIERAQLLSLNKNTENTLFIIDIDHFKKINDTYGHQGGDQVLRELGVALSSFGRKSDFVARYGGEEFMIFSLSCGEKDAVDVAARLHQTVNKVTIGGQPVTTSIGVAVGKESLDELYRRADLALYKAKNEGRNTIRIYQSESEQE